MPQTLAIVTFEKMSQIPADAVQNSFAFAHSGPADGDAVDAIVAQLDTFYTQTVGTQTNPLCSYFSKAVSAGPNDVTVDCYNITGHLDGSPHGTPYGTTHFTLPLVGDDSLPEEVCACLSFHSPYGADLEFGAGGTRPRARDRGRIYFGPLATAVVEADGVTNAPFLATDLRVDLAQAAGGLMGDVDFTWSVWSRAKAALDEVVGGWVDDAFDTQRRRGNKALARTTF